MKKETPSEENSEVLEYQFLMNESVNNRLKLTQYNDFPHGIPAYLEANGYRELPAFCAHVSTWESTDAANQFVLFFRFGNKVYSLFIASLHEYRFFMREYLPLFTIMDRIFQPEAQPSVSGLQVFHPLFDKQPVRW